MRNLYCLTVAVILVLSAVSRAQHGAAGTWRADGRPWTIVLRVEGTTLTGTVDQDLDGADPAEIFDGQVVGQTITFKANNAGGGRTITFTGTLNGDAIVFSRAVQVLEGGAAGGSGLFGSLGPQQFTVRRSSQATAGPQPGSTGPPMAVRAGGPIHSGRVLLLEQTSEDSANVSIGDLNGDGHLDVVLAKGRHSPLVDRVFLNDGRGRFPTPHNLGDTADRSYSASLADMDGDRDLDVVISNDTPDPKLVYLNHGNGRFSVGSTYGRPEWPTRNASVVELNGDGLPDIIVANRTGRRGGGNYVCLNRGKGRFDSDCLAFASYSATTIIAADFNGDGFMDLAAPNRDGGQSYVYINDGKAGFAKQIPFGQADAAIRVVGAADLDGDGLIDIVSTEESRGTFIHFNQANGMFAAPSRLIDNKPVPYALGLSDLNLDGRVDIVVGNIEARPVAYINDGSGRSFRSIQFGDNKGTAYGFAFGDLDNDSFPDIAMARSGAPNVVYFGKW
jgi:hypothetical protein